MYNTQWERCMKTYAVVVTGMHGAFACAKKSLPCAEAAASPSRNANQIFEVCQSSRPMTRTITSRHRKLPNPIVPAVAARSARDSHSRDDDGGGGLAYYS